MAAALLQTAGTAHADYVGSLVNRVFLDPDSVPELLDGYDNNDEISYILETTPRDTGSTNGEGAWATLYVPAGVEIVGVDFVEPTIGGNYVTRAAEVTDDSYDGCGQRGCRNYSPDTGTIHFDNGSVAAVTQDVGIFFSTDTRTTGTVSEILPALTPTGPETKPAKIFNQWDYDQVKAFGMSGALSDNGGTGNTPIITLDGGATWTGIGSPVAGPNTYYKNDYNPACSADAAFISDVQCAGPWQRVAYPGSLLGDDGDIVPSTVKGPVAVTSVPTSAGISVSGASPLPAGTNAVRWVHGHRTLGELEYSRVKFRITDKTAFLASFNNNTFCLDSTGGDTSDTAAKDDIWRYYEPEHRCFADLNGPTANAIILKQALFVNGAPSGGNFLKAGDVIGWQISFTNTSGNTLTNIALDDVPGLKVKLIEPGANALCPYSSYDGSLPGPTYTAGTATSGNATWSTVASLDAGQSFTVKMCGVVIAGAGEGDIVENTGNVSYQLPDASTENQSSTASGTVAGGLIDGRVRVDLDGDGDPLDVDAGIGGLTITLWNDNDSNGKVSAGDTVEATDITLADGSYAFQNLANPGKYVVQEEQPALLQSSADRDNAAGTCATGNGCNEIAVTLLAGGSSRGNDFYEQPQVNLAISKTEKNGEPAVLDQDLDYTITVTNLSDVDATEVVVVDTLDPDTTYVSDTAGCNHNAGVLTCNLGTLLGGASTSFDVVVHVKDSASTSGTLETGPCDDSEDLCNRATVDSNEADSDTGDNSVSEPTNVVECAIDADCDDDVFCNGLDFCEAGVCKHEGDPCANGDICGNTCNEDADNCFVEGGTVCRTSAGVCDQQEACTGSTGSCPTDQFLTSQCRASGGICDVAENCSGSAADCPDDGFEASTTTCRSSDGICDDVEQCDGSTASCPEDEFEDTDVTCRTSGGICDIAETCDGSTASCPGDQLVEAETICRSSDGVCDVEERCDGSTATCPNNGFVASDVTCRASGGVCDNAELCTGTTASCPGDALVASTTICRASDGICDAAENCDGSTASCPEDEFVDADVTCRASGGICDIAEKCDGSTSSCPSEVVVASDVTCRASGGICDVAEQCDGSAATCPTDVFVLSDVTCRTSGGVCDNAELCTGSTATCPVDAFVSSATTCRGSEGICDNGEKCTGTTASCPVDAFVSSATTCRGSEGICDNAEKCTGSTSSCPGDAFVSSATTCRSSGGVCDIAEKCTGSTGTCPGDSFVQAQTTCRTSAGVCDVSEQCSGSTAGCPGDALASAATTCRGATGVCDAAEKCTGSSSVCPADNGSGTCKEICRNPGFYSRRSGEEHEGEDVTRELLDAVGGVDVCGEHVDETSIDESVEGLGMSSALEGLCVRVEGNRDRTLYRQLLTAALNCAISGTNDCDGLVGRFADIDFSTCDSLCIANTAQTREEEQSGQTLRGKCIKQLACFNNGGRVVNGKCAFGRCDITDEACGGDFGTCAPFASVTFPVLQVCNRFPDSCRDEEFCQPGLNVCPVHPKTSSQRACRDARDNDCTIDDCSIDDD